MRLAVITPFLDRAHGTERCIVEQLERFPAGPEDEIHIYSQHIKDLRGVALHHAKAKSPSERTLIWHRVPSIPGPHLLKYMFWFFANHLCRWRDQRFRGLRYDLVYSAGINAVDAEAISVHILFHEFYRQVVQELDFRSSPVSEWPRIVHRRIYYRLIISLEEKIYKRPNVSLAAISGLLAAKLQKQLEVPGIRVIRYGVDTGYFSPSRRSAARAAAREQFNLDPGDFTILLIGNDWRNKGLHALLRALVQLRELSWKLLVVGKDNKASYLQFVRDNGVANRVLFLAPSADVLQFYAAAEVYVGPSLEDAYGLPIIEAMACGLPVVCSSRAGASEVVTHGKDGVVLRDPRDETEIAGALETLIASPALCQQLGEEATRTAQSETWGRNAELTWEWLQEVLRKKKASDATGV